MKTKLALLTAASALLFTFSAKAQLQDEKNVTITMDLQPILQLNLQGPDQLDFTFDQINKYYAGITKYGATILKCSSTVSFDLWAAGLSNASVNNFLWDNPVLYGGYTAATLPAGAVNTIPVTALELHQFPANPAVGAGCATVAAQNSDYSLAFQPILTAGNNCVYPADPTNPYTMPTSANAAASDKFIAGGTGTGAGCQVTGGSYLLQAYNAALNNYYYVIDYRILPYLPVVFPFHDAAAAGVATLQPQTVNNAATNMVTADNNSTLDQSTTAYAAPGVYTMYVKYIMAQDQ